MEHIKTPKIENVKLVDRLSERRTVTGQLFITATHLIFVDQNCRKEKWILHSHISSIEKLPLNAAGCPIKITCRTFHIVVFVIPREKQCLDLIEVVNKLSQPESLTDLHAFSYKTTDIDIKSYGWNCYDTQREYLRMGILHSQWSMRSVNENYELCDTYPRYLYFPTMARNIQIIGSSKFRSRGRLPVLSYLHTNKAAICRCSQPLAGFRARCLEDEQLLDCISEANPNTNELCVIDTRPMINAMANAAAGKGFEKESNYSNIKFQFVGIENIHIMRSSLQKLIEVSDVKSPTMNNYLGALESSGWLKHIKAILETAIIIATKISEGTSVLVHCSDGWDRTAQTCSLSSMMLDPYYRTIQGFQTLVEKEWLSFGHKFTDRCRLISVVDSKEESPVFTQFLECIWQIMNQFPSAFQFNERFLLTVHDHVYSCQFGTFLGNCEKDRVDLRLNEKTYSLWGYILSNMADFVNPFYKKESESQKTLLIPKVASQNLQYWKGMYNRFDTTIHERESVGDVAAALLDHNASLEDHIHLLEKRVHDLAKLLGKPVAAISQKLQGLLSAESLYCLNTLLEKEMPSEANEMNNLSSFQNLSLSDVDSYSKTAFNPEATDDKESGFEEGSLSKSNMIESIIRCSEGLDNVTLDQISEEVRSVAINLKSLRNRLQCSCSKPFEHNSKRYHCCKCGNIFCSQCIKKHTPLPGHYSQKPVPVCKGCYKVIKSSPSSMSLQLYAEQHPLSDDLSPTTPDHD